MSTTSDVHFTDKMATWKSILSSDYQLGDTLEVLTIRNSVIYYLAVK